MMKKSIAVLGLGKYGKSLVRALSKMHVDVLAVDREEENVKEIEDYCTAAICADLTNEESLKALGLKDMDIVVVAIGRNLEACIFAVTAAKEQGVQRILAKSTSDRMSAILRKIGADEVIMPEEYAGKRTAVILASDTVLDYFQVDNSLCMIEMVPLDEWAGKTLAELDLQNRQHINVVAVKGSDGNWIMADHDHPLSKERSLLAVMERETLGRLKD